MRNLIRRLERSSEFWFVTSLSFIFFLLRLPSLFEPYWYGDEGIYQTIGLALTRGRILYTQIWDNKPPLLYYTYALAHSSQFLSRSYSLVVGLASVIVFFCLARLLFRERIASLIATAVFVFIFGLPMFEGNIANAENFMLLPVTLAGLLIYKAVLPNKKVQTKLAPLINMKILSIAGVLLGIAFLYKIVAVFDFAAFFVFIIISTIDKDLSFKKLQEYLVSFWRLIGLFILSFFFPFLVSVIYFAFHGALGEYIHATFLSTVGYVGYKNAFIIPQGLLISKVLLLGIFSLILFIKRQKIASSTLFILIWVGFSIFNSFFSQRPYTHYLLVLIPSISLLIGKVYFERKSNLLKYALLVVIIGFVLLRSFDHWSMTKTVKYYGNFLGFVTGHTSLTTYDSFFDRRTLRDTEIIRFINSHKRADSTVYVWGNDAQIYPLTGTIPPGRFTVAYHVAGIKPYEQEVGSILKKNPPTYIVIMNDVSSYPFPMYNYKQIVSIENTDIYERTN